jgi:predicted ferric reductase
MSASDTSENINLNITKRSSWGVSKKHKLGLGYLTLIIVPFIIAETLGMQFENLYRSVLSAITLIAMMVFFVQFPLAGRIKRIPLFANIDWSIAKHKQLGKYLGIFFFLHPLLILAPKLFVSFDITVDSLVRMVTSDNLITAIIAWCAMLVWVLMSIFKDNLKMRYETWRLLHVVGFVIIATLATLHITSVGSHGQYNQQFNLLWWTLYCSSIALVIYNYFIKPNKINANPFAISEIKKVSDCDWQLSVAPKNDKAFNFEAGQFAWINTSDSAFNLEQHPFSISTGENNKSQLSFIIRELGDYTSSMNELVVGQTVYVDGPYGSMSLDQAKHADGITLIAGGAGIAPMLSLLRQLDKTNDHRPIRLIYGNQSISRMVCLDELLTLEMTMNNFELQLLCEDDETDDEIINLHLQKGFIRRRNIEKTIPMSKVGNWEVYLCGPEAMMNTTSKYLKKIGVSSRHTHFEQLSF